PGLRRAGRGRNRPHHHDPHHPGLPAERLSAGRDRGLPVGRSRSGARGSPDRVGPALGTGEDERCRQESPGLGPMSRPPISLAAPRVQRARWTPVLMASAAVIVIAALWSGLVHLGLDLPQLTESLHDGHGPMMILGFLGTLITMERAVALGERWAFLGPACAAAGGLAVLVGLPLHAGPVLLTAGGVVLVVVFARVHRIQASLHNAVMALGALCWVVAGGLWLAGWEVERFVPWLAAFLVLTIAG